MDPRGNRRVLGLMKQPLLSEWADRVDWPAWETLIRSNGVTIDRPRHSIHPVHDEIVYPIDYGFVNGTESSDGEEIDIFVGTADSGLVGAIWTTDHRKGDQECKFLIDCTPEEVYLVNGFLNFDRSLMEGRLVLRRRMREMWAGGGGAAVAGGGAEAGGAAADGPDAAADGPGAAAAGGDGGAAADGGSTSGGPEYTPIDCGFYDRLEHWAVRGEECDILLDSGASLRGRFVDFENAPDGEYAHLASGERVRLDRIVQVNGVPRPGAAC